MEQKVAAILGVGPGLGTALAKRFAKEEYAVALMARREEVLEASRAEIESAGGKAISVPTDATSPEDVAASFERVRDELGDPEVFVYNAGAFHMQGLLDITPQRFEECFRINCAGAFHAAQQVLPAMVEAGRGTFLITGATAGTRGSAEFSAFATGKFALRALSQSMAREFGPQGIHVAHVIIDGQIDTEKSRQRRPDRDPEEMISPDAIAETYWRLHAQHPSAWTLEMDVRPATESF